jgi:hypothetical protein
VSFLSVKEQGLYSKREGNFIVTTVCFQTCHDLNQITMPLTLGLATCEFELE